MIDYEHVSLEHIDTTKFFVDIKVKGFVTQMKNISSKFDIRGNHTEFTAEPILRYIALLYDMESEIRKNINHFPTRKRIAAKIAGFKVNEQGQFDNEVEAIIFGQNKKVNDAIIAYCFLSTLNIYYVAHAAYQQMYFSELALSMQGIGKDTLKNLKETQERLLHNEQRIFGGDETNSLRSALYSETSKIELPTPENIVKMLENGDDLSKFSPFLGYKPEKIKYAGVNPPEV
jgi:hypothetical protein